MEETATAYIKTTVSTPLQGNQQVDVVFDNYTNQGGERDLWVDYVTIAGNTLQAEAAMIRDRGDSSAERFDGEAVEPGSEEYNGNGALRFAWGSAVQLYGYDKNGSRSYRLKSGQRVKKSTLQDGKINPSDPVF